MAKLSNSPLLTDAAAWETQDSEAREMALDVGQSLAVEAPAGSGKTELLTQRFLALLGTVETPEQIVAITFTRKAAAEMATRVLDALASAAPDKPRPSSPHKLRTYEFARAALDKCSTWGLADNPGRLRIQTIDSFCASITRRLPVESGLGSSVSVCESQEELDLLLRDAGRRLLAQLEDEQLDGTTAGVLAHFGHDFGVVETMVAQMLRRRDQWSRHLTRLDDPKALRAEIEGALAAHAGAAIRRVADRLDARTLKELAALGAIASANLKEAKPDAPVHVLADGKPLSTDPNAMEKWKALKAVLLTGKNEFRLKVSKADGFPAKTDGNARMSQVLDGLRGDAELLAALAALDKAPPASLTEEQYQMVTVFLRFLSDGMAHLRQVFRDRGVVDFIEVAARARQALSSPAAKQFRDEIRHLLVDEFQDTSTTQYDLVAQITTGWDKDPPRPGGERSRTLFLVGDPMQSIYRFREARVDLFLHVLRNKRIGDTTLDGVLRLRRNFRSSPDLVNRVNQVFAGHVCAGVTNDMLTGAVAFKESVAAVSAPNDEGFKEFDVRFVGPTGDKDLPAVVTDGSDSTVPAKPEVPLPESEAAGVADVVEEFLALQAATPPPDPLRPPTVAVLVRARGVLPLIIEEFHRREIKFRAIEVESLAERPAVRDLHALVRALLHAGDRLSWLAVLRAPWCGLELADLTRVAEAAGPAGGILDAIGGSNAGALLESLSPAGRVNLARISPVLARAAAARCHTGLRRLVETAWRAMGGPQCRNSMVDLADAEAFFDLLEGVETGGDVENLALLQARTEALFAPPDPQAGPAVQVMTIHKAKGLEFDWVILPGIARRPASPGRTLMAFDELPDPSDPSSSHLIVAPCPPSGQAGKGKDPLAAFMRSIETQRDRNEMRRLFYVAATRAKRRLIIFAPASPPPGARAAGSFFGLAASFFEGLLAPRVDSDEGADVEEADEIDDDGIVVFDKFKEVAALDGEEMVVLEDEDDDRLDLLNPPLPYGPTPFRRLPADTALPPPQPALSVRRVSMGLVGADPDEPDAAPETPRKRPAAFGRADSATVHAGTVAHRYLFRIAREGLDAWPSGRIADSAAAIRCALRQLGVSDPAALDAAAEKVAQALLHAVSTDEGRSIMRTRRVRDEREFPVSCLRGGSIVNRILDRFVVEDDGTHVIIDYKTSSHQGGSADAYLRRKTEEYRPQLDEYAQIIGRLTGEDPANIRRCLYFPLLGRVKEW